MDTTTVFITRYVADHEAAIDYYASVFGREPDARPVPNCREWVLAPGVLFQVIADEHPVGVSYAFGVHDVEVEARRMTAAGVPVGEPWRVPGFDTLRYAELTDPEGVTLGILDGA